MVNEKIVHLEPQTFAGLLFDHMRLEGLETIEADELTKLITNKPEFQQALTGTHGPFASIKKDPRFVVRNRTIEIAQNDHEYRDFRIQPERELLYDGVTFNIWFDTNNQEIKVLPLPVIMPGTDNALETFILTWPEAFRLNIRMFLRDIYLPLGITITLLSATECVLQVPNFPPRILHKSFLPILEWASSASDPSGNTNRLVMDSPSRFSTIVSNQQIMGVSGRICRISDGPAIALHSVLQNWVQEGSGDLLVFGGPGCGKTTTTCALVRWLSGLVTDMWVVAKCDEMASPYGLYHPAMGHVPAIRCSEKSYPEVVLRTLADVTPKMMVLNELVTAEEFEVVRRLQARGPRLLLQTHAIDMKSLIRSDFGKEILHLRETFLSGGIPALKCVKPTNVRVAIQCVGPNYWKVYENLTQIIYKIGDGQMIKYREIVLINGQIYTKYVEE